MVSRGDKADVAPEAFSVVNGKLYLNYNRVVRYMSQLVALQRAFGRALATPVELAQDAMQGSPMLRGWSAYPSIAVHRQLGRSIRARGSVARAALHRASGFVLWPIATQSPIAAAYDRTPLHAQYQWHRTAISKCVDRLDEPRPTGFRFLGELKSSRGSVPDAVQPGLGGHTLEYAVVFLRRATH